MIPEAVTYLTEAIDHIQLYALRSKDMDWTAIRSEALTRIATAQTTADTYPTLRWVLSCLGDHHSHLASPQAVQQREAGMITSLGLRAVYPESVIVDVHPNSPAAQAGLQVRDRIETINGEPSTQLDRTTFTRALYTTPLSLTVRRAEQPGLYNTTLHATAPYSRETWPQGRTIEPGIGYLELPAVTGSQALLKTYALTAQQCIRDMGQAGICRWVIDLRRNGGGDMWAMVAGVQALLGEGECGFFISATGKQSSWLPMLAKKIKALLDEPYVLRQEPVALAVLTSRLTCSSGEFTALAFRGHPHARSFGEPTAGLPTGNQYKILSDGAQLFLTVALGADRTGRSYNSPIVPDELVTSDWTQWQTERDPILHVAGDWCKAQRHTLSF